MVSSLRHAESFVAVQGFFVAALGLLCSCGVQVFSLSSYDVQAPGHVGSAAVVHRLQSACAP